MLDDRLVRAGRRDAVHAAVSQDQCTEDEVLHDRVRGRGTIGVYHESLRMTNTGQASKKSHYPTRTSSTSSKTLPKLIRRIRTPRRNMAARRVEHPPLPPDPCLGHGIGRCGGAIK